MRGIIYTVPNETGNAIMKMNCYRFIVPTGQKLELIAQKRQLISGQDTY